MPRRKRLMNELIFSVYRTHDDRRDVKVTVGNVNKPDAKFMAAVAGVIAVWMSARRSPDA